MAIKASQKKYDIAISFAGEDRRFARILANALKKNGISVFYDDYEKAELWGKDLYQHLSAVYQNSARYCVVLVSKFYKKRRGRDMN